MPEFNVTFTQYHNYVVEANDEDEAESLAYEEFMSDMRRSIAQTWYNEVEVEEVE